MPGVSTNTICPRGSLKMPEMRLRVVCGLAETMLTLAPMTALSRVDLPTLGRPTRATYPLCMLQTFQGRERGVALGLFFRAARPLALDHVFDGDAHDVP